MTAPVLGGGGGGLTLAIRIPQCNVFTYSSISKNWRKSAEQSNNLLLCFGTIQSFIFTAVYSFFWLKLTVVMYQIYAPLPSEKVLKYHKVWQMFQKMITHLSQCRSMSWFYLWMSRPSCSCSFIISLNKEPVSCSASDFFIVTTIQQQKTGITVK